MSLFTTFYDFEIATRNEERKIVHVSEETMDEKSLKLKYSDICGTTSILEQMEEKKHFVSGCYVYEDGSMTELFGKISIVDVRGNQREGTYYKPVLDYFIHNSGNSDGYVLLKEDNVKFSGEGHLGNYGTVEDAQRAAVNHFMIARPEHFHVEIAYLLSGMVVSYAYERFEDVLKAEGIEMPDFIKGDNGGYGSGSAIVIHNETQWEHIHSKHQELHEGSLTRANRW